MFHSWILFRLEKSYLRNRKTEVMVLIDCHLDSVSQFFFSYSLLGTLLSCLVEQELLFFYSLDTHHLRPTIIFNQPIILTGCGEDQTRKEFEHFCKIKAPFLRDLSLQDEAFDSAQLIL